MSSFCRVSLRCGVAATLVACSSDPVRPVIVNPLLAELRIDESALRHGGTLLVLARPAEPDFVLRPNERVEISITSGSGDEEVVQLTPYICAQPDGTRHVCNSFLIGVSEGHDVSDLAPLINELPGRFTWLSEFGRDAAVRIFEGDLRSAMRRAEAWPNVQFVELNGIATVHAAEVPGLLATGAPVEYRAPLDADRRVQANPGSTLELSYQQPTGERLAVTIAVP